MSDTTNLALAVTGVTVFDHIKNMLSPAIPAMIFARAIYVSAGFVTNAVAGDHYISVALKGRMVAPFYRGIGYSTLNLSRAVEDGGTLISPLIPWNACGAFVISTLGLGIISDDLENLLYIPLAFTCWPASILGLTYAAFCLFRPRRPKKNSNLGKTARNR